MATGQVGPAKSTKKQFQPEGGTTTLKREVLEM